MDIPLWFWFSLLITIIHTIEESAGSIWKTLGIPAAIYFMFQAFVVSLSWSALVDHRWVFLFSLVRAVDCVGTHWLFKKPGIVTSPLLLLDVIYLASRSLGSPW